MIGLSRAPVTLEIEPNNNPQQPQSITVPAEIVGQFYPARDVDRFQFQAKKDQVFVIDLLSHRLGSSTDPFMQIERVIQDSAGKVTTSLIAQVDDPSDRPNLIGSPFDVSSDDPTYRFVAPDEGTYRVTIYDQFSDARVDPRMVYRLEIRNEQPDFRLYAVPEEIKVASADQIPFHSLVLRRGGTTLLKVSGTRIDGFSGDIQLSVEGLPSGVACAGGVLSAMTPTAWLVFEATEDAAQWAGAIRVIGKAQTPSGEIVRQARTGSIVWGTANRQAQRPEFRVARDLYLSVIPETVAALVRVGEPKVYETSIGGTLELPIQLARRAGFAEAIKLVATNVPNEIKPADVDIAGDKSEGKLAIAINNPNGAGTYTFYLRADSKFSYQRNPEAAARATAERDKLVEIMNQLAAQVQQATAQRDMLVQKAAEAAQVTATAQQAKVAADTALEQTTATAQQAAAALEAAKQAAAIQPNNQAAVAAVAAAEKAVQATEEARVATAAAAEQATTAITDAQTAQQVADEAKTKAEQAVPEAEAKVQRATEAKTALDQSVDALTKASQAAEVQVALVSTPIQLHVVNTAIYLTAPQQSITVKRKAKADLAVQIERRYGYAAPVELTIEAPQGISGVAAEKIDVPADLGQGALAITAAEDATVGRHTITVKAKGKFNNVDIQAQLPVVVEVVE
jgi:hypothetical protein